MRRLEAVGERAEVDAARAAACLREEPQEALDEAAAQALGEPGDPRLQGQGGRAHDARDGDLCLERPGDVCRARGRVGLVPRAGLCEEGRDRRVVPALRGGPHPRREGRQVCGRGLAGPVLLGALLHTGLHGY